MYLERGRQRWKLVAEFFDVTEYEIRKAVKLTRLIPQLQAILEVAPKRLPLACADLMADYDPESQGVFAEICTTIDCLFNKATMQHIVRRCPPPIADWQDVFAAWREARDKAMEHMTASPKKISFNRKVFAPYLDNLIFMNQVITQGFQVHIVNEFLRSLCAEMDNPPEIKFKTFAQYGGLLMDIAEAIDNNFEYSVRYYDNKGYNAFEIVDVYPLED